MSQPILQKNLEALAARYPELARDLANTEIKAPDRFLLIPSQEQAPTLIASTATGQQIALHHPQQPLSEAAQWADRLPQNCLQGANVLILGVGLAYHIHHFLQKSSRESQIAVLEPDRDLFGFILREVDLSLLLSTDRISWLVGTSPQETVNRLQSGSAAHRFAGQGLQLLSLPGFRAYYPDYLENLAEEIQAGLIEAQVKHRTIRLQGRDILKNILDNLPRVMQATGVAELQSLGAGVPAFVVAPGPSLTHHLESLRIAGRKGYVIAVDTAARILRREEVPYHFVVTIDHTELNELHFDNADSDPACLVAYPGVQNSIPAIYEGRTYFYDHEGSIQGGTRASRLLDVLGLSDRLGSLISLGSTTDTAYHLARRLACCPMVLVGVDLAFPEERFYAAGAMQEEKAVDSPHTSRQYKVPNNCGGEVITSHIYRLFRNQLAELIRSSGGLVYNTSPEGAQIPCTSVVDLRELLSDLPDRVLSIPRPSRPLPYSDVVQRLEAILEMLKEDRKLIRPWEKELRRLDVRNSRKFRERIIPILKEIASALKDRDSFQLAASLAEESASEILGQVDGIGLLGGSSPNANDVARERFLKWIREVKEGIDYAAPLFQKAIRDTK